ncbi:MAG: VOC family protein [Bradymonadia bacterium]
MNQVGRDEPTALESRLIIAAGAESLGEPMAMPGMGTFGYFKDPSGTPMGLIGP